MKTFTFEITENGSKGSIKQTMNIKAKTKQDIIKKILATKSTKDWDSLIIKINEKNS